MEGLNVVWDGFEAYYICDNFFEATSIHSPDATCQKGPRMVKMLGILHKRPPSHDHTAARSGFGFDQALSEYVSQNPGFLSDVLLMLCSNNDDGLFDWILPRKELNTITTAGLCFRSERPDL